MKRFVARKSRRITVKFLVLLFLFIFMTLTIVRYMFISSFEIDSVKANHILSSTVRMPKNKLSIFDFGTVDAFLKDNFKNLNKVIIKREAKLSENIKNASALGEPLIYIYNTHQTEEYAPGSLKNYNITPTVYMAANILKENLRENGINAIVEDSSLQKGLSERGLNYNGAYTLSYEWLTSAKERYPSVKYFIDLHRDSVSASTTINNYIVKASEHFQNKYSYSTKSFLGRKLYIFYEDASRQSGEFKKLKEDLQARDEAIKTKKITLSKRTNELLSNEKEFLKQMLRIRFDREKNIYYII